MVLTKIRNKLKRPKTILNNLKWSKTIQSKLKSSAPPYIIKTTCSYNRQGTKQMVFKSSKQIKAEQNQNWDFHHHIFNPIFLLTQSSSVFQIIHWNRKHLTNCQVQRKKVFWHVILHRHLCNALCKFFIKIWSKCFSRTYSEIKSTWLINSSKEEIALSKYRIICAAFRGSFWSKSKAHGSTKSKKRHPSWLYCNVVGLSKAAGGSCN